VPGCTIRQIHFESCSFVACCIAAHHVSPEVYESYLKAENEFSKSSSKATKRPRGPGCRGSLHRRQLRSSEKRGSKVGKTKRGKGTKIMAVADRNGLPVSIFVESATPHEVKLAVPTLVQMVIPEAPRI
jgi:hypothetical protein